MQRQGAKKPSPKCVERLQRQKSEKTSGQKCPQKRARFGVALETRAMSFRRFPNGERCNFICPAAILPSFPIVEQMYAQHQKNKMKARDPGPAPYQ